VIARRGAFYISSWRQGLGYYVSDDFGGLDDGKRGMEMVYLRFWSAVFGTARLMLCFEQEWVDGKGIESSAI
jgi:hypothetical protein